MSTSTGKFLIVVGIGIVIIGIVIYFFSDRFQWLGRLPGDIRIEKESFKFYFPITTLIIISVVINLIILLFRRL